ncbi:hypothetical protein ACFE04_025199 [Oxalis oulophora]
MDMEEVEIMDLPPGFRFHPTDEEIITHYLTEKVMNNDFIAYAIGEVDLNKCEPWDLPKKAKMGEKEWYFFCQRDRKYPTGMRTNRATESGYWKATGKDKEIYKKGSNNKNSCLVGMKKTLVFYKGRAPKGEKTNWVMHEFRLEGKFSYYTLPNSASRDEWVVSRVFHKNNSSSSSAPILQQKTSTPIHELLRLNSHDNFFDYSSLPPLIDPSSSSQQHNKQQATSSNYSDGPENNDIKSNIINHSTLFQQSTYNPQFDQQVYNNFQTYTPSNHPSSNQNLQATAFGNNNMDADREFLRAISNQNKQYCKVEQLASNHEQGQQQSVVSFSQDTGISTDMNNTTTNEISSEVNLEHINWDLF